jgi:hypothetical protein
VPGQAAFFEAPPGIVHHRSPREAKVGFFGALFAARTDVYAVRYVGLYPLLDGDKCWWLAADFDGSEAMFDALMYVKAGRALQVPVAQEASRSGIGGSFWLRRCGQTYTCRSACSRRRVLHLLRPPAGVHRRHRARRASRGYPDGPPALAHRRSLRLVPGQRDGVDPARPEPAPDGVSEQFPRAESVMDQVIAITPHMITGIRLTG